MKKAEVDAGKRAGVPTDMAAKLKTLVRTTVQDEAAPCPCDHVNRVFHAPAPNRLWLSDFTYVSTWSGFVYVAFVIDAYARRIVGWRVSRTAHASFVLDALEQGHSKLDAIRSLKHYLAREVFTLIMQRQKEINASRIAA